MGTILATDAVNAIILTVCVSARQNADSGLAKEHPG
jgi:hypothetical protein